MADANPIVVAFTGSGWHFIFAPVLIGATNIMLLGLAFNYLQRQIKF